jgi:hypothetical protein
MQDYSYYRNRYEEIPRPPHARAHLAVAALLAVLSSGLILGFLAPTGCSMGHSPTPISGSPS